MEGHKLISRVTPAQVLRDRLADSRSQGRAILGAGTGTGLVAKAAAAAQPEFIVVYCTSKARVRGFPTSIIGDPNGLTLELLPDVLRVASGVPVVAGIQPTDPTRDMEALVEQYKRLGCAGVINYPSSGLYGPSYIGGPYSYTDGLKLEAEVMKTAQEAGLVTMSYIYRPEEATVLVPYIDVAVSHAGWTTGGMDGAPEDQSFQEAAKVVNEQLEAVRELDADCYLLAHGGPFSSPEDVAQMYSLTIAEGFVGASSVERIPVERAVEEVVRAFKELPLGTRKGK